MGRTIVAVRIAGEIPVRAILQLKGNLARVIGNDACIAGRRRGRDKRRPRWKVGEIRPVVDLRRIGDCPVRLSHLEARGVDTAARDRALAVLLVIHSVVRAEHSCKTDVLYSTTSCIAILRKGGGCSVAVAAGDACRRDRRRTLPVVLQYCLVDSGITKIVGGNIGIYRRAVVDLRHIGEFHRNGTRGDDARRLSPAAVRCQRFLIAVRPRRSGIEDIVLRRHARTTVKGSRIGNVLLRRGTAHKDNILRCIVRRRGVRARLTRHKTRKRYKVFPRRERTVAIRLLRPSVVDLRDVAVDDRRREQFRCDLSLAGHVKGIRQRCIDIAPIDLDLDVVVAKPILRRIVRVTRDVVGDTRRV